ncbi:MAG: SDR family oxidoreductase [FCB group bacterium]|nr:SDR family oxidoreductase [FCB group bacterium]
MGIFTNKSIIITGSASGIGRALAEELARRGASLILTDINKESLQATAGAITKAGGTAKAAVLDVTDVKAVKQLVDRTVTEYGRLDYIFNNAGIVIPGEARDYAYDDWRKVIDTNLYGVIHGVAAAYPVMCRQGFGHIVNTASLAGLIPATGAISYTASKYGVVGLSHALRVEASDLGVKVSVVCPGMVDTPINNYETSANLDKQKMLSMQPKNLITAEKSAEIILRGVERNKSTILVTAVAKIFWPLHRINPDLMMLMWKPFIRKMRKARLKA